MYLLSLVVVGFNFIQFQKFAEVEPNPCLISWNSMWWRMTDVCQREPIRRTRPLRKYWYSRIVCGRWNLNLVNSEELVLVTMTWRVCFLNSRCALSQLGADESHGQSVTSDVESYRVKPHEICISDDIRRDAKKYWHNHNKHRAIHCSLWRLQMEWSQRVNIEIGVGKAKKHLRIRSVGSTDTRNAMYRKVFTAHFHSSIWVPKFSPFHLGA